MAHNADTTAKEVFLFGVKVNKYGYIGLQTSDEIEYAKKNNKEIIYMEEPK